MDKCKRWAMHPWQHRDAIFPKRTSSLWCARPCFGDSRLGNSPTTGSRGTMIIMIAVYVLLYATTNNNSVAHLLLHGRHLPQAMAKAATATATLLHHFRRRPAALRFLRVVFCWDLRTAAQQHSRRGRDESNTTRRFFVLSS